MPGLFRPSTIPRPWRQSLAVFALLAWVMVVEHWLVTGPLLWILRALGPWTWGTGMSA